MLLFLTQKQTISEKSDFLSSLVKLKDALQAQSKDHKKAAVKEVSKIKISLDIYLFFFFQCKLCFQRTPLVNWPQASLRPNFFLFFIIIIFLLHKTVFHGHSCKRTLTRVQWVSLNMHAQLAPFRGWSTSGPVEPSEWSLSLKQWDCVVSAIRVPKNEEEDWGRRGGTVPESVVWKQLKPEEADPRNVWFFPNFFSAF